MSDRITIQDVVYVPKSEREYRDQVHRPARYAEDSPERIDTWYTLRESEHPTADVYRCDHVPYVYIIRWGGQGAGAFTITRNRDGIRASMDASTWDRALDAAYAYAAWDDATYAF